MRIKFGLFESCGSEVQAFLKEVFEPITIPEYTTVYMACPHMRASEEFAPHAGEASPKTLEVYFFSYPKEMINALTRPQPTLIFNGESCNFSLGQSDTIYGETPSGFTEITDDNGTLLGVSKGNQIWIFSDILHGVHQVNSTNQESARAFLDFTISQVLLKLSPEELQKIMDERLIKRIITLSGENYGFIKSKRAEHATNVQSYQEAYLKSMKDFVVYDELCKNFKEMSPEQAIRVIENMRDFTFVDSVKLAGNSVRVQTHDIKLGPLNFGKWQITISTANTSGVASMVHEHQNDVYHPYEYDPGRFSNRGYCFGGFVEPYTIAICSGMLDKALLCCRMLITNYQQSTRMQLIENFLTVIMGKQAFKKAMAELCNQADIDPKVYQVSISSIAGNEITLIGIDPESKLPTKRGVVKL